jgi:hypothetical protein
MMKVERPPSPVAGAKTHSDYTVDDAIEHAGMGRFQITLFLTMGFYFALHSSQLMVLGFILPVLQKYWDLDKNIVVPMVGCSVFVV